MELKNGEMTLDAKQLNSTDVGILELLNEGRASPRYLASELDKQQPYVNQRLKRLLEHGHVRRVDRGLYELSIRPEDSEDGTNYRQKALEYYGEECVECGATEGVEIHHINRNREDNRLENLIPLCRRCHRSLHNEGDIVTFQIQVDDETWREWKNTVPRSKSLDTRIRELIKQDAEATDETDQSQEGTEIEDSGLAHVDDTPTPEPDKTTVRDGEPDENSNLAGVDFPSNLDRYECITAAEAARDVIRDRDGATKKEIVQRVMPEHPLGYDVDAALAKIEAGERYRGSWWRKVIKPGLESFSDVQKPKRGASKWKYRQNSE